MNLRRSAQASGLVIESNRRCAHVQLAADLKPWFKVEWFCPCTERLCCNGLPCLQLLAGLLDPGIVARQFLKELRLNKCNLPEASNSKRGAERLGLQRHVHVVIALALA